MGLDWVPISRPKPGCEAAHAKLLRELRTVREFHQDDASLPLEPAYGDDYRSYDCARELMENQLSLRLRVISISTYEEVNCPRVGIDPEATELFRKTRYERGRLMPGSVFAAMSFEEALQACHGEYMSELARTGDCYCSPDGFRGNLLRRLVPWLGQDLVSEAYRDHDPAEAVDYARRLEEAWEASNGGSAVSLGRHEDDLLAARIISDTIAWLRFWGGRGFGFEASY